MPQQARDAIVPQKRPSFVQPQGEAQSLPTLLTKLGAISVFGPTANSSEHIAANEHKSSMRFFFHGP
jgi:hypothetical protein